MKSLAIPLTGLFLALSSVAHAQVNVGPAPAYGTYPVYRPWGDFGGGLRAQHHASTAAEGYLRGWSDFLRGAGQYNLLTAEARMAHAAARDQEIRNRQQSVQAYYSLRELNKEKRRMERGPRVTHEEIRRMAATGKPAPVSPSDVDWISGQISWPLALQHGNFGAFRSEVEKAFAQRAALGRMDDLTMARAEQAAREMLDGLKMHVRAISPQQYMTARRFVESLAHEIQQSAG